MKPRRIAPIAANVALVAIATPSFANPPVVGPAFRSASGAVACTMTTTNYQMTEFTCFRVRDGHFVRFTATDLMDRIRPAVTTGIDPVYVGANDPAASVVRVGRSWATSDAALIECRVRGDGVRCRHWRGPWFFIGSERGERTGTR